MRKNQQATNLIPIIFLTLTFVSCQTIKCGFGQFITSNNQCSECLSTCSKCHDLINPCAGCSQGYLLNYGTNKCDSCKVGQMTCTVGNITCQPHYKYHEGHCEPICQVENCQQCPSIFHHTCTICHSGFHLSPNRTKCLASNNRNLQVMEFPSFVNASDVIANINKQLNLSINILDNLPRVLPPQTAQISQNGNNLGNLFETTGNVIENISNSITRENNIRAINSQAESFSTNLTNTEGSTTNQSILNSNSQQISNHTFIQMNNTLNDTNKNDFISTNSSSSSSQEHINMQAINNNQVNTSFGFSTSEFDSTPTSFNSFESIPQTDINNGQQVELNTIPNITETIQTNHSIPLPISNKTIILPIMPDRAIASDTHNDTILIVNTTNGNINDNQINNNHIENTTISPVVTNYSQSNTAHSNNTESINQTTSCLIGTFQIDGLCQNCYSKCATCINSADQCLECAQDWRKYGWKCVKNQSIVYNFTFASLNIVGQSAQTNTSVISNLGTYLNQFKDSLISSVLPKGYSGFNSSIITLDSVNLNQSDNTLHLSGLIDKMTSLPLLNLKEQISNQLSKIPLSVGPFLLKKFNLQTFPVISATGTNTNESPNTKPEVSKLNLAAILIPSILGGLLLLSLIGCLLCYFCKLCCFKQKLQAPQRTTQLEHYAAPGSTERIFVQNKPVAGQAPYNYRQQAVTYTSNTNMGGSIKSTLGDDNKVTVIEYNVGNAGSEIQSSPIKKVYQSNLQEEVVDYTSSNRQSGHQSHKISQRNSSSNY